MKIMKIRNCIYGCAALAILSVLSGCTDRENIIEDVASVDDPGIIHIGGIANTELETSLGSYATRADDDKTPVVDAETVDWLLSPLFGGLDITYGKVAEKKEDRNERVAILKLLKKDGATGIKKDDIKYSGYTGPNGEKIAEYSFKYRTSTGEEGEDAKWYGNGAHYFQGVFVPDQLRYMSSTETTATVNDATTGKAKNLKIDQSKDGVDDNYTLLERYLGMPADATINATVGRVKLPFRHRLARVQAYVLIDPTMGDVTIEGYKKDINLKDKDGNVIDDAATTEIKFCKVKVLAGVEEKDDETGHATLTPRWDEARKAIPHFVGEKGCQNSIGEDYAGYTDNFIMFYDTEKKVYIFPANDKDWEDANTEWTKEYNKELAKLGEDDPRRETKAAEAADEESGYKRTVYGKVPVYDLIVRPTYKTAEKVMYDEDLGNSNAEAFAELENSIDFELTLSTGLQYTKHFEFDLDANYQTIVYLRINRKSIDYNSSGADKWDEGKVNEDGYYGVNNQNGNTLSYAGSSWQRAYRIGSTNPAVTDGHYYGQDDTTDDNVQDDDVMPWYPQYVDTDEKWIKMFAEAHVGGLHHGDYFILDKDITIDATKLPADFVFTGHLDGQDHTITLTGMGQKVVDEEAWDEPLPTTLYRYIPAVYYLQEEIDAAKAIVNADGYQTGNNPEAEVTATKTPEDVKVAAHYEAFTPTSWSQIEDTTETLYSDDQGNPYVAPDPIHHPEVSHTSGSTLFAGLNGAYDAAIGEANVHKEGNIYVPYVDPTSKTGWRAEVINTIVKDADMFPADVIKTDGTYDVNKVSGYIYNCWKVANPKNEKIKSHTPTLPKYK